MGHRVGMTTDLIGRKQYWMSIYPSLYWTVLQSGLTYDEAIRREKYYAQALKAEYYPGGERKLGAIYSIYSFYYPEK